MGDEVERERVEKRQKRHDLRLAARRTRGKSPGRRINPGTIEE